MVYKYKMHFFLNWIESQFLFGINLDMFDQFEVLKISCTKTWIIDFLSMGQQSPSSYKLCVFHYLTHVL